MELSACSTSGTHTRIYARTNARTQAKLSGFVICLCVICLSLEKGAGAENLHHFVHAQVFVAAGV